MSVGKKYGVGLRSGKSKSNLESSMGALPLWLNQVDQNLFLALDFDHCNCMFHQSLQPLGPGIPAVHSTFLQTGKYLHHPWAPQNASKMVGQCVSWLTEYNVPGHS